MDAAALSYRPCAGVVLVNRDNLVFTGQRIDTDADAWQLPQGGLEPGEDPQTGALRELEEETGVPPSLVEVIASTPDWLTYDLPPELLGKVWKGRYRGQKQMWLLARFLGTDAAIRIDTKHPEFRAWRWSPLHDLPSLAVPFKRDVYAALVSAFAPYLTR